MPEFTLHIPAVIYVTVRCADEQAAAACGERLREEYGYDSHALGRKLVDPQPAAGVAVLDDAGFETRSGNVPGLEVDVVPMD